MKRLLGAHFLWWDTFLSPDTVGKDLVLPQLGVQDFVDSPTKERLTSSEELMGVGWGGGGMGEGEGTSILKLKN